MMATIVHTHCPACKHSNIRKVLIAQDYTVSQEKYEVWECGHCSLRFTQGIPDAAHIGKYYQSDAYVSHSDTQQGIVNKLYHIVRNITLRQKSTLVAKASGISKGRLLDVGAGTGAFAHVMQQQQWQVTALEPDATAVQNAQKNYGLTLQPLQHLFQIQAQSVDVITMWHVLEHVHDLHNYLATYKKVLQPNGTFIVAVPNYTSGDALHYQASWAAYDVPRHLYHFSPRSMQLLMQQHGFEVAAIKPMWFDSVYVSMLSESYATGKRNLLAALWHGLRSNLSALRNTAKCSSIIYIIKHAKA